MSLAFSALLWTACCLSPAECREAVQNYVWLPCHDNPHAECRPVPYEPCEGDMLFYDHGKRTWGALYRLFGSGPPTHSGIVFRMPDGCLMILEAGSLEPKHVNIVEVQPRLKTYYGQLYVRRLHHPMTPEQSACLTNFALDQAHKGFAKWRIRLEALTYRNMSKLLYCFVDPAVQDKVNWICSDLVLTGAVRAGLLPPEFLGPQLADPRDLFYDNPHCLLPWYGPPHFLTPEPCMTAPPRLFDERKGKPSACGRCPCRRKRAMADCPVP